MSRRLLPWLAVTVIAITALLFFGRLVLTQRAEEQVRLWAEARRAEGYTIAWQGLDIGGFPLALELGFAEPRIAKDGWSAAAPHLTAILLPWQPNTIDLSAPSLAMTGPGVQGGLEQATATLLLDNGIASKLTIDGINAAGRARNEDLGRADRARLVIDRFAPLNTDIQVESLSGKMTLRRAQPAAHFAPQLLFSDPFDLDLDLAVKGPIRDLPGWRDAGGIADLTRVLFAWGPLKIDGNGTFSLDGQMRPLAASTAKLQGLNPVLDRLVAKGQMKAQEAAIAKVVLGMVSQPAADGTPEVTIPITAQNGKLYLGPVPVATLRPVVE